MTSQPSSHDYHVKTGHRLTLTQTIWEVSKLFWNYSTQKYAFSANIKLVCDDVVHQLIHTKFYVFTGISLFHDN
jgi:hypothetical protein